MALKNYTTMINSNKTIGEIQEILAKHKAKAILTEYDDEGEAFALSFKINTVKGEIAIKLPANTEKVYQVLKNTIKSQAKQIENTKALYDRALSDLVKADKQIDLYIEELISNEFDRCCQECCKECEKDKNTLSSCIKQYFERKVENER